MCCAVWFLLVQLLAVTAATSAFVKHNHTATEPNNTVKHPCACVFDFDETLRVVSDNGKNRDMPAREGQSVIRACKKLGCAVAIASANHNLSKMTKVLDRIDNTTFTPEFFASDAFQYDQKNKTVELLNISRHFGLTKAPKCVALFDDMMSNKKYADAAGILFIKVKNTTGVRMKDFQQAISKPGMEWPVQCALASKNASSAHNASGHSSKARSGMPSLSDRSRGMDEVSGAFLESELSSSKGSNDSTASEYASRKATGTVLGSKGDSPGSLKSNHSMTKRYRPLL